MAGLPIISITKFVRQFFSRAMFAPWNKSIALLVLIPVFLVSSLALSSMLMSVWVTLDAQHDAEAINLSGSLRMQSYRIAAKMQAYQAGILSKQRVQGLLVEEVEQMDHKLTETSIFKVVENGDSNLVEAYQRVIDLWLQLQRPLILDLKADDYLYSVEDFVNRIEQLVMQIQLNSEDKHELLGGYQGISIVLSLLALLFVYRRTNLSLVSPLNDLVKAAEQAEKGNFNYRAYYQAEDEVGLLCQTFNKMSESLAQSYSELENRVEERTQQLMLSNRSLDFLFRAARRVSEQGHDQQLFISLMEDLREVLDVKAITLHRAIEANSHVHQDLQGRTVDSVMRDQPNSYPLLDQEDYFGYLTVELQPGQQLSDWQSRLLKTSVDLLASNLALHYQARVNQRLMLFEERSVIARELHDSLAQSLSYMKLQVQRLHRLLEKGADQSMVYETLNDMEEGLNQSYKHLRELLTTFRMKINAPTLQQALHAVIEEFKHYDHAVSFKLDFDMDYSPLTPNEDIHVLQIIREAMNNALKHAGASEIVVRGWVDVQGRSLAFSVADNGVGMDSMANKDGHYGLETMQERAEILKGVLSIQSVEGKGTEVQLRFEPLMWSEAGL
jgi:two-component system nitrate/nitrite sensor histidine kinase NarX